MASDHHRRPSASPAPPPAPPLPPQRYSDVAKNVLDRLRLGSRKSVSNQPPADDLKDELLFSSKFGPSESQSTSHRTGLRLRALDANKDKTRVVLAGGKVLKTLRFDETSCTQDFDLRSVALNYWDINPENQPPPKRRDHSTLEDVASIQRATFDIEDVAWSNGQYDRIIATAVSNGNIILYDLERPGVVARHLREHQRQVHKVDFNPAEGKCLLSGSQDGTVILWDLRSDRANSLTASNGGIYDGRSEGVRHVKWSPVDTWSFAFGTDNGAIQRWDTRHLKAPLWKVLGHNGLCNSVDWHPDGKHLVTAGKDKSVRVWDTSPDMRRRKPVTELRTPHEVQNVRWRPPCFVSDRNSSTIKQCTNFATSYKSYPYVHIWDLRRPHMPFREVYHQTNTGTNDMMWRSRDLLWTVGPGGEFMQTDIRHTPRTLDHRPLQTFTNAPGGELSFFTSARLPNSLIEFDDKHVLTSNSKHESNPNRFSRSPGDDSLAENFLSSSYKSQPHSRTPSMKSQSLGTTPPTAEEMVKPVVPLDQTLRNFKVVSGLQASKHGAMPGVDPAAIYTFFAEKYKSRSLPANPTLKSLATFQTLFERNALYCQKASRYRDAQTWRILGMQVSKDLEKRAEENRRRRLQRLPLYSEERQLGTPLVSRESNLGVKQAQSSSTRKQRSTLVKSDILETKAPVTSSNAPTPLARPINGPNQQALNGETLSLDAEKPMELPKDSSLHATDGLAGVPSGISTVQDTEHSHWDTVTAERDEKRAMVNQWRVQPKHPLSLDQPLERSSNIAIPGTLDRRDSSDSMLLFSTSSGSRPKLSTTESFISRESSSAARGDGQPFKNRLKNDSSTHGSSDANSDQQSDSFKGSFEDSEARSTSESIRFSSPEAQRSPEKSYPKSEVSSRPVPDLEPSKKLMQSYHAKLEGPEDPSPERLSETHRSDSDPIMGQMEDINDTTDPDIVNNRTIDRKSLQSDQKPRGLSINPESAPGTLLEGQDAALETQELTLVDYLAPIPTVDDQTRIPVDATDMLQQLLSWYSAHGDAQTATHLYLLSAPLLAPSTKLSGQAQHPHGNATQLGLSEPWVESILSTYHEQLMSLNLINPASDLRQLCYPDFPAVYEQGLKDTELGTLCLECRKPINNPVNKLRCETCHARQASCPICWCKESPYGPTPVVKEPKRKHQQDDEGCVNQDAEASRSVMRGDNTTRLWSSCAICNHGSHAACAHIWFTIGGGNGGCPVPGCICACVDGAYRQESLAKFESLEWMKGRKKGGVRRDDWRIGESKAAGRATIVLRGNTSGSSRGMAVVQSSPETERGAEEGRRVRINVPGGHERARGRSG